MTSPSSSGCQYQATGTRSWDTDTFIARTWSFWKGWLPRNHFYLIVSWLFDQSVPIFHLYSNDLWVKQRFRLYSKLALDPFKNHTLKLALLAIVKRYYTKPQDQEWWNAKFIRDLLEAARVGI